MTNKVQITINDKEVLFAEFRLVQELGELHSFAFRYQIESSAGVTVQTYLDFYDEILNSRLEVRVEQKKIFEGIITAAECLNQYEHYIDFQVSGHCKMILLDQETASAIFHKKTLADIFRALTGEVPATLQPLHTDPLHYTVQHNQSAFQMIQMLCKREGEWFYYDGSQIQVKRPDGKPIRLDQRRNEVFDLQLDVRSPRAAAAVAGYDILKAKALKANAQNSGKDKQTLFGLAQSKQRKAKSENMYGSATVPFEESLKRFDERYRAKWQRSNVVLKGKTNDPAVTIGARIEIRNGEQNEGVYIVTKISHEAAEPTMYVNHFEAIVDEAAYAPYVDPETKVESSLQYATVSQNEDKDGLGRVKVKFWWSEEESCWMNVLTPHAGTGRGFRFLPEIGDQVLVGFYENNIESPYLLGSLHHEEAKDEVDTEGNHIKTIATGTNRRIQFDEKKGLLFLTDFYKDEKSGNRLQLEKADRKQTIRLVSQGDEENHSQIQIDTNEGIDIAIRDSRENTVHIQLKRNGQELEIFAEKAITVHSTNEVSVKAQNIRIEGDQSIKMKTKSFELESQSVKVDALNELNLQAGQKLDINAMQTEVKGGALLNLNGGAQAVLKGGMVMIN